MIKQINRDINLLNKKAELATKKDVAITDDLLDTLKANQERCVGMAANMIGVNKRIIVVQMGILPVIMINPQIIKKSQSYVATEGCLSLMRERETTRYEEVEVTFLNKNYVKQQQKFSGWIAQIIQHEVDHCEGIII